MEKTMNPFLDSTLVLRRRGVWEAADSGVILWKDSFVYFIPFFALPVWICAFGLRLLSADYRYLPYFALWWLKPFFDRLVLHVVSRRFFGAPAFSRFDDLRRGFWKNLSRGLLGDLFWRRFSPWRSARMPLRVLERPGRKQFRLRKKILAGGGLDFCFFLSSICLVLEGMLLLGEAAFVSMMTQMFFPTAFSYIRENLEAVEIFIFTAFCLNFILVESLYVCMGFGLYINSRVEVEGWDLQLLFQKFSGGTPGNQNKASNAGKKALLFLCLFFMLKGTAFADSEGATFSPAEEPVSSVEIPDEKAGAPVVYFPGDFPAPGKESIDNLETILASPDFGSEKEGWAIRLKDSDEAWEIPEPDLSPWLEKIRRAFGFMLRILLIMVIAAFAVFAFYRLRKYGSKGGLRFSGKGKSFVNPLLFPESPELLFTRAEDFFEKGMVREAWAACFAACVRACEEYYSLSFPPGATEYDCLKRVSSALPRETSAFGELVRNWVLLAYGGRDPGGENFRKSLTYGKTLLTVRPEAHAKSAVGASGGAACEP